MGHWCEMHQIVVISGTDVQSSFSLSTWVSHIKPSQTKVKAESSPCSHLKLTLLEPQVGGHSLHCQSRRMKVDNQFANAFEDQMCQCSSMTYNDECV